MRTSAGGRAFSRTLLLDTIKEKKEPTKRVRFNSEVSSEQKTIPVSAENVSTPDLSASLSSQDEDDDEEEESKTPAKPSPKKEAPRISQAVADLVKVFENRKSDSSLNIAGNPLAKNRRMSVKRVTQTTIQHTILEARNLEPQEFLKRTKTIRELLPEKIQNLQVAGFEDGDNFALSDLNGYEKGDGDW